MQVEVAVMVDYILQAFYSFIHVLVYVCWVEIMNQERGTTSKQNSQCLSQWVHISQTTKHHNKIVSFTHAVTDLRTLDCLASYMKNSSSQGSLI